MGEMILVLDITGNPRHRSFVFFRDHSSSNRHTSTKRRKMAEYRALEPWKVDSFSIKVGSSETYGELFANGLMQVPITIPLKAHQHDPATGDDIPHELLPHEWATLELQLTADRPLPPAWTGEYVENDFAHQMPPSRRVKDPPPPPRQDSGGKGKRGKENTRTMWLTATKARRRKSGVGSRTGGKWVATDEGGNVSIEFHVKA
jgi:hypothetical protein